MAVSLTTASKGAWSGTTEADIETVATGITASAAVTPTLAVEEEVAAPLSVAASNASAPLPTPPNTTRAPGARVSVFCCK